MFTEVHCVTYAFASPRTSQPSQYTWSILRRARYDLVIGVLSRTLHEFARVATDHAGCVEGGWRVFICSWAMERSTSISSAQLLSFQWALPSCFCYSSAQLKNSRLLSAQRASLVALPIAAESSSQRSPIIGARVSQPHHPSAFVSSPTAATPQHKLCHAVDMPLRTSRLAKRR